MSDKIEAAVVAAFLAAWVIYAAAAVAVPFVLIWAAYRLVMHLTGG